MSNLSNLRRFSPHIIKTEDDDFTKELPLYDTRPFFPVEEVFTDDDGNEVHKVGYIQEPIDNSLVGISAVNMSLQAQIDAGVQLQETSPIPPNNLDGARHAVKQVIKIINNPNNYKSPDSNE